MTCGAVLNQVVSVKSFHIVERPYAKKAVKHRIAIRYLDEEKQGDFTRLKYSPVKVLRLGANVHPTRKPKASNCTYVNEHISRTGQINSPGTRRARVSDRIVV